MTLLLRLSGLAACAALALAGCDKTPSSAPVPQPKATAAGAPSAATPGPAVGAATVPGEGPDLEALRTPDWRKCLETGEAAAGQTAAMLACAEAEWKRQDAALNTAYQALMAKTPNAEQPLIRNAEKAWVTFRDAECDAQAAPDAGGSIQSLVLLECKTDLTLLRIQTLKQHQDEINMQDEG